MAVVVAVALLSAAALGYEILLIRLFSIILWHHFAFMIISLALLGVGASGTFLVFARRWLEPRFHRAFAGFAAAFGISAVACFALARRVPFNPLEVVWDLGQQAALLQIYLLLALPFFCAATCVGLALS
ncbi:MAG: SAM-dependent methyltransferase, partial [Proteobacteria bacterium]|nr:SAM-dependent methyltransferase [Pseudomonadota bacterium]